jgi:predicted Zn-dependent peptidase
MAPRRDLRTRVAGVLTGIGLLVTGLAAQAAPPADLKYPALTFKLPKASISTLPNGMKLYLLEDHELPLVEVSATIRTGAVYVPEGKAGLASLFGATQRSGGTRTRKPEEIDSALDQIAASVATSVSNEYATATLSVLKEDLDLGLSIFADVLMNPEFREERVSLEKAQLIEGIRRRNDDPHSIAFREFNKLLYGPKHPYGWEATVESVSGLTREDLLAFHRRYYHPNNMVLAISGDFKKADLTNRLKKAFAGWKQAKVTWPQLPPIRPSTGGSDARQVYHVPKAVPQSIIVLGNLGVSRHDPDRIPMELLDYILGRAGFTSRLVREIRSNRGLAYSVGSIFSINAQAGSIGAYSFTRADATAQATGLMLDILETIRKEPVPAEELKAAQQSLVNSFVFRFESSHEVVTQQAIYDYYNYPKDWLEKYPQRLQAVTPQELQRVAKEHIQPARALLVVVGDAAKFDAPLSRFGAVTTLKLSETTASRGD